MSIFTGENWCAILPENIILIFTVSAVTSGYKTTADHHCRALQQILFKRFKN